MKGARLPSLGNEGGIAFVPWPTVDERMLEDDLITYVIQVNGKVRCRLELPKDQDQPTIVGLARENAIVMKHLNGSEARKIIFVPNRLLNFVV